MTREATPPPRRTVQNELNMLDEWQANIEADPNPYATPEWKARAVATVERRRDRIKDMDPSDHLLSISEVLASADYDEATKWVIRWQHRDKLALGEFEVALMDAATKADDTNLDLLGLGFPDLAQGIKEWRTTDLATRLRAEPFDFDI
jgi:hypothetical protein